MKRCYVGRLKYRWLLVFAPVPVLLALLAVLMLSAGSSAGEAEPLALFHQEDAPLAVLERNDGTYEYLGVATDVVAAQENGARTLVFAQALAAQGVDFAYIQAPNKTYRANARLSDDTALGNHEAADALLDMLAGEGLTTYDLRDVIEEMPLEESFFRTDHHWTPEAGFRAFQALGPELETRFGLEYQAEMFDKSSYGVVTYQNAFRGAQGNAAGARDYDDITYWSPRFETDYRYLAPHQGVDRSGTFEQALLFEERISGDAATAVNGYTLWSGGDFTMARIQNNLLPEGKTVFVLRDSFGCTFAPFLSLGAAEVVTFDLRHFGDEDIMEYVRWLKPDLVLMLFTTSSTQNPNCFPILN